MDCEKETLTPISEEELTEKLKKLPLSYAGEEPTVLHLKISPSRVWLVTKE